MGLILSIALVWIFICFIGLLFLAGAKQKEIPAFPSKESVPENEIDKIFKKN